MANDETKDVIPPRWGGVRCPGCEGEILPYVLMNGEIGVHFLDYSDSVSVTTLKAELESEIENDCPPELTRSLQGFRAILVDLIATIDAELQRHAVNIETWFCPDCQIMYLLSEKAGHQCPALQK